MIIQWMWLVFLWCEGGGGRPTPFVDSFPLALWVCQPARHALHSLRLKGSKGTTSSDLPVTSDPSVGGSDQGRMQRKRLLKEYYSMEASAAASSSPSATTTAPGNSATATTQGGVPSNGLRKPRSLDSLSSSSSSSSSSSAQPQPDLQVLF